MIHRKRHGRNDEIVYSWNVLMEGVEANVQALDLFIAHKE